MLSNNHGNSGFRDHWFIFCLYQPDTQLLGWWSEGIIYREKSHNSWTTGSNEFISWSKLLVFMLHNFVEDSKAVRLLRSRNNAICLNVSIVTLLKQQKLFVIAVWEKETHQGYVQFVASHVRSLRSSLVIPAFWLKFTWKFPSNEWEIGFSFSL